MPEILSHPFGVSTSGLIRTVEQNSDAGHAEQLAVLALTRPGERPLVPTFGLTDPAFRGFDASELVAAVETFGPPVRITGVVITPVDSMTQEAHIEFA